MSVGSPPPLVPPPPWWVRLIAWFEAWISGPVAIPARRQAPVGTAGEASLPPLPSPPVPPPVDRPHGHVRVCVDFGTSQSAVARAVPGGEPELAVLQVDPRSGRRDCTIDSDIAWSAEDRALLGAVARLVEQRGGQRPGTQYFRSMKRMLSDLGRLPDSHLMLRLRVEALVEELLRIALIPESSSTVRRQAELTGVPLSTIAAPLGLPHRASLASAVGRGVFDVYLCVPNAFGNFEEEVLRDAAWHAASTLQEECARAFPPQPFEVSPPPVVEVHLIREAEAVAWWVLHRDHLRSRVTRATQERWMIYDIGAGSTDAAVVRVRCGEDAADAADVRTEAHRGVAFGGHDIDEMLLRICASRGGDRAPDDIHERIKGGGSTRSRELRGMSDAKEAWSTEVAHALAADPTVAPRWIAWVEAPEGPPPLADVLPPVRLAGELWPEVRELTASDWAEDYGRFARGVVTGLLRALEGASPGVSLDRVLLSGRGSQLPLVRPMVTSRLLATGRIQRADQVQAVDAAPEQLKLACVLGIAVAASSSSVPDELPQALSDEVTLGRHIALFPRGTRLQGHHVRAAALLPGREGSQRLAFYQYRCPREVAAAVGASNLWEHRHLGGAEIHLFEPVEIHAVLDCRAGSLEVFRIPPKGDPMPVRLEVDPVFATGQNPVTRLPFGWVDP